MQWKKKNYIVLFVALFIIGGAYAMEEEPVAQELPTPQSFPDSIQQPDPNNNNNQKDKRKCFFVYPLLCCYDCTKDCYESGHSECSDFCNSCQAVYCDDDN